ncbi:MAG: hypothetical protein M0T74_04215 [Desulfitobacterium hafniense]|nr:hypothetical protein [Desulfitobacterium hafniense]
MGALKGNGDSFLASSKDTVLGVIAGGNVSSAGGGGGVGLSVSVLGFSLAFVLTVIVFPVT